MIITSQALAAFVLFLPAGVANMTPVLANKIPVLNKWTTPLDFGKTYKGKRIFGANKTWRGILTGSFMGGFSILLINWLFIGRYAGLGLADVDARWFLFGMWIGFGALLGDAIESFFKRQKEVPSGHSWFPWDQLDYVLGAILFSLVFVRESIAIYAITLCVYFVLHLIVSYIGYLLGLKDKPI